MLSAGDVFRWVDAGCPQAVIDPDPACPYRVTGHLLTGEEAVICTVADGSCPFQVVQPTIGGRHTTLCVRKETEASPFAVSPPRYMTSEGFTVGAQTPFPHLIRRMLDSHLDRLVVVDNQNRPRGTVSATDILTVVAEGWDTERGHL
jgi:hypothetical protein